MKNFTIILILIYLTLYSHLSIATPLIVEQGVIYEQAVCQGITSPTLAINKFNDISSVQDDGSIQYQVDLAASGNGGSYDCVDARNDYYQQNFFFAWRASSGTFTDITPVGYKPYSIVRWSGVLKAEGEAQIIKAYMGDSLGSLVSQVIPLQEEKLTPPSNLTVTFNGTAYTLSWTDNSSNEQGFKLEGGLDGVN